MEEKIIELYVVIDPDNGWNNIAGIFSTMELAEACREEMALELETSKTNFPIVTRGLDM